MSPRAEGENHVSVALANFDGAQVIAMEISKFVTPYAMVRAFIAASLNGCQPDRLMRLALPQPFVQ